MIKIMAVTFLYVKGYFLSFDNKEGTEMTRVGDTAVPLWLGYVWGELTHSLHFQRSLVIIVSWSIVKEKKQDNL